MSVLAAAAGWREPFMPWLRRIFGLAELAGMLTLSHEAGMRVSSMLRQNRKYFRNRLDLSDRVQVKVVRRRLRLSEADLNAVVQKVGNSIAGISKEIALQRAKAIETPLAVPSAAVIDAATSGDAEATEAPAAI
jgi:hypothetical protein